MAHFAEIGPHNVVQRVLVVSNDIATTEQAGIDHLNSFEHTQGVWKQTSYNTHRVVHALGGTPFRKNYAGQGYTYNEDLNAFIEPKPFPSWTLDETTCCWEPPVPEPSEDDGARHLWNEEEQRWDLRHQY